MEDIFKQLEQEGVVSCQVRGMPWQPRQESPFGPILGKFEDLEPTGDCARKAEYLLWIRACPCISKIRQRAAEFNATGTFPLTSAGLYVSQVFSCGTHRRYFESHPFPFICRGCGIVYEEQDHLVIQEEALL